MSEAKSPKRYIIIALQVFLVLIACGYLTFAFFDISKRPASQVCSAVQIKIMDSSRAGFITREEVELLLDKDSVQLVGVEMERINGQSVQQKLKKNPFIEDATCYKRPDGCFTILISQRLPIMRVMPDDGKDYYIDANGHAMNPMGYCADLVVATGDIGEAFARDTLLVLGQFLRDNAFWNDQIEQAYVHKDGTVDLVTRVGNSLVHIGAISDLDVKFRNLRAFYDKVLPTVGWQKYALINVEHTNQIICKKNKKA